MTGLPIELALTLECIKVCCDGKMLWVTGCRYSWPYAVTIDNLCAVYNAGIVCELVPAPPGANARARALVDW